MLKEVSSELKQLQTHLEAAQAFQSQAGTGTDPTLYEAPMPLDAHATGTLPISLTTDPLQTTAGRPGTGTGLPSTSASPTPPGMPAEDASLDAQPLAERPVSRQAIPPEYRDVFDRLHHHTQAAQSSEATR